MKSLLKLGLLLHTILLFLSCDIEIKPQNFEVEAILKNENENTVSRSIFYNPERNEESSRLIQFSASEITNLSHQKLHFNTREGLPDINTEYWLTSIIQDNNYTVGGGGLLNDLFLNVNYGSDWVKNKMGRLSSIKLKYEMLSDSLVEKQNQTNANISQPIENWLYRINENDPFVSDTLSPGQIINTKMLDSLIFNQLKNRVLDINNSNVLDSLPPFTSIRFPENDDSMTLYLVPHVELIDNSNYIVGFGYVFKADLIIATGLVENKASVFVPIFILFNREVDVLNSNRQKYRVVTVPTEGLNYPPDELKVTNKILVTCENNLFLGALISEIIHEKVKENIENIMPDDLSFSGFQLDDILTGLFNSETTVPENFNVMAVPLNNDSSTLLFNNEGQVNSYEINILSK